MINCASQSFHRASLKPISRTHNKSGGEGPDRRWNGQDGDLAEMRLPAPLRSRLKSLPMLMLAK